jgi:site-specific recombinase XerD
VADHFSASIAGFADWLPFSGRHKNARTIRQYVTAARRLADWARKQGRTSFAQLTKADLRRFLSSLPSRSGGTATASSQATVWWAVRSLYAYLAEDEGIADIAKAITVGRPQAGDRISHLDSHEVGKLLKACQTSRELAVISVALDSGLRISELASLQVEDVLVDDLSARRIIVRGKGGKVRGVVIGTSTARALRQYLRKQRAESCYANLPDLWLGERGRLSVQGLDRLIRKVGDRAGLEIHPHLLRHTWAHHFRLAGGQTDNLCYLAGWSGPAMALKYGKSAAAERAELEARQLSLVDRTRSRS